MNFSYKQKDGEKMKTEQLLLVIMSMYVIYSVQCNQCLNLTRTCTIRHELQFDFAFAFQWNCSTVSNCICYKGLSIVYFDFPPYIEFDGKGNTTRGILSGD